jgi:hypothetical protein
MLVTRFSKTMILYMLNHGPVQDHQRLKKLPHHSSESSILLRDHQGVEECAPVLGASASDVHGLFQEQKDMADLTHNLAECNAYTTPLLPTGANPVIGKNKVYDISIVCRMGQNAGWALRELLSSVLSEEAGTWT